MAGAMFRDYRPRYARFEELTGFERQCLSRCLKQGVKGVYHDCVVLPVIDVDAPFDIPEQPNPNDHTKIRQ